jgi:hypothetical protein
MPQGPDSTQPIGSPGLGQAQASGGLNRPHRKHGLLDGCLIRQLKKPSLKMALA